MRSGSGAATGAGFGGATGGAADSRMRRSTSRTVSFSPTARSNISVLAGAERLVIGFRAFAAEQSAGVTFRKFAALDRLLNRIRQFQKAQMVGDRNAAFADALAHLLLCPPKLAHQARIGAGGLQGPDVLANQVLDQREGERFLVGQNAHHDRNLRQSGFAGGTVTAFPRYDFVAGKRRGARAHQNRLQDTVGANRIREFAECRGVEVRPRLVRVRVQERQRNLFANRLFARGERSGDSETALSVFVATTGY